MFSNVIQNHTTKQEAAYTSTSFSIQTQVFHIHGTGTANICPTSVVLLCCSFFLSLEHAKFLIPQIYPLTVCGAVIFVPKPVDSGSGWGGHKAAKHILIVQCPVNSGLGWGGHKAGKHMLIVQCPVRGVQGEGATQQENTYWLHHHKGVSLRNWFTQRA